MKNIYHNHYEPMKSSFEKAVTFLTGYNGMFNVSIANKKFYFTKSITDDDFAQITIPTGTYEPESIYDEVKRINIQERYFTESKSLFTIEPNFSFLGSIVEISLPRSQIALKPNDSIRDLLGFKPVVLHEEDILSEYPVDIL